MAIFWAMLLKPFFLLLVMVLIVHPIKALVWRYLPDGRLKRALFRRIN